MCRILDSLDGTRVFICKGDPETRWIAGMVHDQQQEIERLRNEDQPLALSNVCDECGRQMFTDTPGILECLCGEKFQITEQADGAQ